MKPIEFVTEAADGNYNAAAGDIMDAVNNQELVIASGHHYWEVLSYYYDATHNRMVIDIGKLSKV